MFYDEIKPFHHISNTTNTLFTTNVQSTNNIIIIIPLSTHSVYESSVFIYLSFLHTLLPSSCLHAHCTPK